MDQLERKIQPAPAAIPEATPSQQKAPVLPPAKSIATPKEDTAEYTAAILLLGKGNQAERLKAIDCLAEPKQLNPAAISALVKALGNEDYTVRSKVEKLLPELASAAANIPENRKMATELGLALEKTLGDGSSTDSIRRSLSARCVLQDMVSKLTASSTTADLAQPIVDKLVKNIVSGTTARSVNLSGAALSMAAFKQTFAERGAEISKEKLSPEFDTLPNVYVKAVQNALGTNPKEVAMQRGAAILGNVVSQLPSHMELVERNCADLIASLNPKSHDTARKVLLAQNIKPHSDLIAERNLANMTLVQGLR